MIYSQICVNFRILGKNEHKKTKAEWTSYRQDKKTKLKH